MGVAAGRRAAPAGATAPARPHAARSRQRPQPRLPPRPARPHAGRRARSGRGASRCTGSRRRSTPTSTTGWRGRRSPRWCWPASRVVGEFHYLHHAARRDAVRRRRTRWARRCSRAADRSRASGSRCSTRATSHGGHPTAGYARSEGTQRRFSDGTVDGVGRAESTALDPTMHRRVHGSGPPIHSVRAVDPPAIGAVAAWAARPRRRAARPRLRAAGGERATAQPRTAARRSGCWRADSGRSASGSPRCTRRISTSTTSALLAHAARSVCMCPTTERDLADGIGPTAGPCGAGVPMCLGSDSHAVIDLFEEARARRARRAAGVGRAGHPCAVGSARGRNRGRARAPRVAEAARSQSAALADLVTVGLAVAAHRRRTTAPTRSPASCSPPPPATCTTSSSAAEHVVRDGATASIDVAAELDASITRRRGGTQLRSRRS